MRTQAVSDSRPLGPGTDCILSSAQITRYIINIPQTQTKTCSQGLQTEKILKYLIFIRNGWILRFYGEKIKTIKKRVRDILSTISQAS